MAITPDARDKAVQRSLVVLAEMRQASISAETLMIYGRALRAYETEDLRAMLEHYRQPRNARQQGETAMPDLPTLEGVVQACRGVRLRAATEAKAAADEVTYREQVEREIAAGMHEPTPETRETMNRLQRILDERKSGTLGMSDALSRGDVERESNTRRRAAEERATATATTCGRCDFWASMTPAELRKIADQREHRLAQQNSAEIAAA